MGKQQNNERLAMLEAELRGRLMALEVLAIALARRTERGEEAVRAAINMFSKGITNATLDEPDIALAQIRAFTFEAAMKSLQLILSEVSVPPQVDGGHPKP